MRGKLIKPQARLLYFVALLNFLSSGWLVSIYFNYHFLMDLLIAIFPFLVGVFALIMHWRINHPEIPKWAEDFFTGVS